MWCWTWLRPHLNAALPCMVSTHRQTISSPMCHFKQDAELCGRSRGPQVNKRLCLLNNWSTLRYIVFFFFNCILMLLHFFFIWLCSVSVLVLTPSWTWIISLFWPGGWRCGFMLSFTDFCVVKGISKRIMSRPCLLQHCVLGRLIPSNTAKLYYEP